MYAYVCLFTVSWHACVCIGRGGGGMEGEREEEKEGDQWIAGRNVGGRGWEGGHGVARVSKHCNS